MNEKNKSANLSMLDSQDFRTLQKKPPTAGNFSQNDNRPTGRQSKSDLESDRTAQDELFTRHLFFEVSLDFHDLMILHFHHYMSFGFGKMFSSIILRSIHCWTPFHLLLENWLLKNINGNITTSFRQYSLYILDYMFNTIKPIYKL